LQGFRQGPPRFNQPWGMRPGFRPSAPPFYYPQGRFLPQQRPVDLLARLLGRSPVQRYQNPFQFGPSPSPIGNQPSLPSFLSPGNLSRLLGQTQQVLRTVQQVGPMIQQYGPLIKNLPSLWKIYKGLSAGSENTEEEETSEEEVDWEEEEDLSEEEERKENHPKKEKETEETSKMEKIKKGAEKTGKKRKNILERKESVPKLFI